MASKKKVAVVEGENGEELDTVAITHNDDEGNPVTVVLPNDNRVLEYKRSLRENGKHFTAE